MKAVRPVSLIIGVDNNLLAMWARGIVGVRGEVVSLSAGYYRKNLPNLNIFFCLGSVSGKVSAETVKVLFSNEKDMRKISSYLMDPAAIPFILKEIMKTIVLADPSGYSYYQSKLAQLQGRIEGILSLGYSLIYKEHKDELCLDMSGSSDLLFRSLGMSIERPKQSVIDEWSANKNIDKLTELLNTFPGLVLVDYDTPKIVRDTINRTPDIFLWEFTPPVDDKQDYPLYLFDNIKSLSDVLKWRRK